MFATVSPSPFAELTRLLDRGPAVVLTGAGVSTESGVPGYRDESGAWLGAAPMQYAEFIGSETGRQRYWARSHAGFGRIAHAAPNRAHEALCTLEKHQRLELLVTQNVDRLHQKAGSKRVLDLHGRLDQVVCLGCEHRISRVQFQQHLGELNPGWRSRQGVLRPDGDIELGAVDYSEFRVPNCPYCDGLLKPDVVFFGERVPPERHRLANEAIARASVLLVIGSSLVVNSGYRLVRTAQQQQVPVVIFNRGVTRADPLAAAKFEGNAGDLLEQLVHAL